MGFIGLIRSIEDLLYELITWIVFYPRTLWRVLRHPQQMMEYSDREQGDTRDQQYTDTLSPPIFLMLTILLAHGVELGLGQKTTGPGGALGNLLGNSEETLLFFRLIVYSIFPLVYAAGLVDRSDRDLTRQTLREPFFSQCYPAAVFVLVTAAATQLLTRPERQWQYGGLAVMLAGVAIYTVVQAIWLRHHLPLSRLRAALVSIGIFLKGLLLAALTGAAFST